MNGKPTIHDNALNPYKDMFAGDKKFQVRARKALPILVQQAHGGETISYKQLAAELGMWYRNLGTVCACISTTLYERVEKKWGEKIPRIANLVIKDNGKISPWVCKHLTKDPKKQPTAAERVDLLQPIYEYPKWNEVLDELRLPKVDPLSPQLIKSAARYRSTGESQLHKDLKNYVADNPMSLDLKMSLPSREKEFELPSGDRVDVLFKSKRYCFAVEVKARISNDADLLRGIFQCVKYREVLKARRKVQGESYKVDALLAIEGTLTEGLRRTSHLLKVKVFENIRVDG
ncbi:hypothetical protein F4Z99_18715 [Candidatus Poribacteria bacterium]|nr:hypothetical protein [Candidatus Poribacteria bacterium]MYB00844.1 hypothetical protein [Candidatus Poribacteria bacterium]